VATSAGDERLGLLADVFVHARPSPDVACASKHAERTHGRLLRVLRLPAVASARRA